MPSRREATLLLPTASNRPWQRFWYPFGMIQWNVIFVAFFYRSLKTNKDLMDSNQMNMHKLPFINFIISNVSLIKWNYKHIWVEITVDCSVCIRIQHTWNCSFVNRKFLKSKWITWLYCHNSSNKNNANTFCNINCILFS